MKVEEDLHEQAIEDSLTFEDLITARDMRIEDLELENEKLRRRLDEQGNPPEDSASFQ